MTTYRRNLLTVLQSMADATLVKADSNDYDAREQERDEVRWDTLVEVQQMIEAPDGLQNRAHLLGVELESTPEAAPPQKVLVSAIVLTHDDGTEHYEFIKSDDDDQHSKKISAAVEYFTIVRPCKLLKLVDIK
jgi:hypothetical protein